jgi:predicted metal-binding membrane protein
MTEQRRLAGVLLALAAAAWIETDLRMAGMDAGPGTNPGPLGFYLGIWAVMTAAMMLPAVTPMVLSYREIQQERRGDRSLAVLGDTALFLGGYLVVWVAAGLLAYLLLEGGRSLEGEILAWHHAGRWVAAGVLGAAALYQLTPSKSACLTRCRSRGPFLPLSGRPQGLELALGSGIEHGAWCLGCCWALMAALFALGAMSVGWMVLISVLIVAERLLPWRASVTGGVAAVLAALAIGLAIAPAQVPMLTIPGSSGAMRAMGQPAPSQMGMSEPTGRAPRMGSMP